MKKKSSSYLLLAGILIMMCLGSTAMTTRAYVPPEVVSKSYTQYGDANFYGWWIKATVTVRLYWDGRISYSASTSKYELAWWYIVLGQDWVREDTEWTEEGNGRTFRYDATAKSSSLSTGITRFGLFWIEIHYDEVTHSFSVEHGFIYYTAC